MREREGCEPLPLPLPRVRPFSLRTRRDFRPACRTTRRVLKIPKTPDCVSGGRKCESERGARRGHESCTGRGPGLSVHRDTMAASPGATPARVRALTVQVRVPGSNDEPGGWLPGGRRTQGRRAKRSGALGEAGDEDCGSKRREQRAPHAPPQSLKRKCSVNVEGTSKRTAGVEWPHGRWASSRWCRLVKSGGQHSHAPCRCVARRAPGCACSFAHGTGPTVVSSPAGARPRIAVHPPFVG